MRDPLACSPTLIVDVIMVAVVVDDNADGPCPPAAVVNLLDAPGAYAEKVEVRVMVSSRPSDQAAPP